MTASEIVGLLADADRRRVFAAMVLGASTVDDIARTAGLDTRSVVTALHRMGERGLVIRDGEHAYVVEESFSVAARAAAQAESQRSESGAGVSGPGGARDAVDVRAARVLKAFVRDGRILQMPTQASKRRILLAWLVQDFEPGRRYSEKMVNLIIGKRHADTAAWRRALVDEDLLDRDHGEYWRIGGEVDLG